MTTSVVDYGYGDTPVDYGYGDAKPETDDYGYGDAKPDTDYGYGDATPDTDYGYGDATPDMGYGDAAPDMGYGDARPDTDYGYGDAAPSSAAASSQAEYGYGDAAPDMGYGDASPDADRATELVETKKRPKRRCSVTRYSLVSPTGMVGGEEAAPKDIASTTYDESGTQASTVGTTSSQSSMSEVESNQHHQPSRDIHREQQRLESSGPHNPPGRSHSDAAEMYRYASGNVARGGGRRHGNQHDGGGDSQDGDDHAHHHHQDQQQGARGQQHGKGGVMKRMNRIRKRLSLAF